MSQIRVEIFIPLYYNPDENGVSRKIEDEKFIQTLDELFLQFGGYSVNRDPIDGAWLSDETKTQMNDESRSVWIVCEYTDENKDYLMHLKETLMERFQQEEILIMYYPVNRL